ncbi:hypothetical protein DdX_22189 [Ditylenchus destructor]|uniref:Uncharacterized protein n=1 Tax=Ditylenchus destructor TaxID=166010 RepID=A0AAD4MDZ7_9BILA|nr:hypothetical protein DdX_22189 [Ditylenchus destructor]
MTAFHVMAGADHSFTRPAIRKIGIADLVDAPKMGLDDFSEKPSHYVFPCLMYPIAGIALAIWAPTGKLLPLLFPLMSALLARTPGGDRSL